MKLYFSKGACSLAVRITLHELGVPCKFESVDLKTKTTETGKNFLEINPKGVVPVLVLDNQEILTENAAIQQYLADTYKAPHLLASVGTFKRYRTLEWLTFISTDLHKGCSPLFNSKVPQDLKNSIFIPNLKKSLNIADIHLNHQQPYLMGEEFTVADSYLFVILSWLPHFEIQLSEWKHLSRYVVELRKRPAIQQSLKEEGFLK